LLHFQIMRRLGIRQALAYDQHFTEHGFEVIGG
jgi:predicted nucleic acid-binding protein